MRFCRDSFRVLAGKCIVAGFEYAIVTSFNFPKKIVCVFLLTNLETKLKTHFTTIYKHVYIRDRDSIFNIELYNARASLVSLASSLALLSSLALIGFALF